MIISRYLFREVFTTLIALTALLLLIYISHRFMAILVQAAAGAISAEFILQLLLLKLLGDVKLIIPLACFLAILLALGRLYKDNEITAMAACGIAMPWRSVLALGVLVALFVAFLSLFVAPWAESQKNVLRIKAALAAEVGGVSAGRFKSLQRDEGVIYVEAMNNQNHTMEHIFAQTNNREKHFLLSAAQGHREIRDEELFIVLQNGRRYEADHKQPLAYTVTEFAQHSLHIPQQFDASPNESKRPAIASWDLWQSADLTLQAELQWRLSLPLTVIILAALAIPLAHTNPRQGQYAKFFSGVLIFLVYNNLLGIAQKWVSQGTVPLWLGVWWVHGVLLLVVGGLLLFPRWRWRMGARKAG